MKNLIFNFNKFNYRLLILFFHISFLFSTAPAYSEEKTDLGDAPIRITSDKMIAEKGSSMVEFIGNVEATREDSILLADSMKVYFVTDKKKPRKMRPKAILQR